MQTLRLKKCLVVTIVLGVLVSLATGLVRNEKGIGIPEINHYGHPLVWRVTNLNGPTEYVLTNLAIDTAFWIIVSLVALFVFNEIVVPKLGIDVNYKILLTPLVLFIPLGLVMDFVHEVGHAMWGTAVGGRLTYLKIAYLEIYPRLAIASQFQLGLTSVDGLTTDFAYGFMLLGGSMTTNIVSWLIGLILFKTSLGNNTKVALKVLGLLGILDLPFYVFFPQIGLRHWILLGGCRPEPLLGARKMGIPDPAFYLMVVLSTLGLVFFYFKPLCEKVWKKTTTTIGGLKLTFETKMLKPLFGAVVCGVLISLATGAIENPPEASIIGATYYGYPLVWRVTMTTINNTTSFRFADLALDALFCITISFVALVVVQWFSKRSIKTA